MMRRERNKEKKVILGQTTLKQHTRVIRSGKGCREKLNDVAESQLQPPKPATHTTIRQQSSAAFLFHKNQKCF